MLLHAILGYHGYRMLEMLCQCFSIFGCFILLPQVLVDIYSLLFLNETNQVFIIVSDFCIYCIRSREQCILEIARCIFSY